MKKTAAALIVAALLIIPSPARADDEPDIKVVVTAGRVEEAIEEVPASVSVITAEDLASSGEPTLVGALQKLAGVRFRSTTGSPIKSQISMRGFGENSHGRVLVLLNGRRLNRPDMAGINWLQIPVENVERVEVIRGAASSSYGDNAVAGVINIITRQGNDELEVSASVMGGSFRFNQERVGVSGRAGPVRFALNSERTASDGYRDRSAYDTIGGAVNLDAEVSDTVALGVSASYQQAEYELPGALTREQWKDDSTQAGNPSDEVGEQYLNTGLQIAVAPWDLVDVTLDVFADWTTVENDIPSTFVPLVWPPTHTDLVLTSLGVGPKVALSYGLGPVAATTVVGSDIALEKLALERYGEKARVNKAANADLEKRTVAVYVSNDIHLTEELLITAGGRFEAATINAKATMGAPLDDSKTHTGVAYEIGVLYRISDTSRAYAAFDRVYRYPFLDEQVTFYNYPPPFGAPNDFNTDLEAEWGHAAELGLTLRLMPDLLAEVSGYLLLMQDEIDFGASGNENLDNTRHLGADVALDYRHKRIVRAVLNYSYNLATFRAGDNEGKEIPLVPNHELFAELTTFLPLGFEVSGNLRGVGEAFQGGDKDNKDDRKVPGYFLLGADVTFRNDSVPGELELFAGVENILDSQYLSYIYWSGYYPGNGRSWNVGVNWRY
jgi:iron complex outermembrane receptor protein